MNNLKICLICLLAICSIQTPIAAFGDVPKQKKVLLTPAPTKTRIRTTKIEQTKEVKRHSKKATKITNARKRVKKTQYGGLGKGIIIASALYIGLIILNIIFLILAILSGGIVGIIIWGSLLFLLILPLWLIPMTSTIQYKKWRKEEEAERAAELNGNDVE